MADVDFQAITKANVYLRNDKAGVLEKQSNDRFVFQYDPEYLTRPDSLDIARSMKMRADPYVERSLHPFFDNLIPEGWLLQNTEAILHIDKANRFAILMATGRSPIGAVTVRALDSDGREIDAFSQFLDNDASFGLVNMPIAGLDGFDYCPTCFKPLPPGAIHRKCVAEMWGTAKKLKVALDPENPLTSFAHVIYGGSISGAQKKGAFYLDRRLGILRATPIGAQYILKPDGDFPELPENEHVTMAIAKAAGFDVPPFSLIHIAGLGNVLAVRRFDIAESGIRLMMEDMGQLIRVPSDDKYESSYEKVVSAIRSYSSAPKIDIDDFFRRMVFSYLVGNADMHLKNWTLVENERALGTFKLAPCYDMLNTRLAILGERVDIGLPMQGRDRNLQASYLRRFGGTIGIPQARVESIFGELSQWLEIADRLVNISMLTPKSKRRYLEIVRYRFGILTS